MDGGQCQHFGCVGIEVIAARTPEKDLRCDISFAGRSRDLACAFYLLFPFRIVSSGHFRRSPNCVIFSRLAEDLAKKSLKDDRLRQFSCVLASLAIVFGRNAIPVVWMLHSYAV
jgi:hypothetical protein